MRNVENSAGRSCTAGQLEAADDAAAVGGGAQQVAGVELGLAEEHVGALVVERDELAQDHAGRRLRQPAEPVELGLALVAGRGTASTARRSLRSSSGEAGLVGVVEDQAERRLLRVVEAEHLRQQDRAERRHRRAHGTPVPDPPSARNSTGYAVGVHGWPTSAARAGELVAGLARPRPARTGRP